MLPTVWYPSIEKNVFVGAMESSTIHQGTREQPWPPVYWIIGIQTLSTYPVVACKPALIPLDYGLEVLENIVLDNHPQMREPLWKSSSSAEKSQHTPGGKNKY